MQQVTNEEENPMDLLWTELGRNGETSGLSVDTCDFMNLVLSESL